MLNVSDLSVWYHKAQVLSDIEIEVPPGFFVAIIGANGAGKTTLLRSILNLHQNKQGSIEFEGQSISQTPTHKIVRKGICYVPDYRGIVKSLTVKENFQITRNNYASQSQYEEALSGIFELFPNLKYRHAMLASLLSGGEQQMLAIARTLMYQPKILLIDEPSIGLAPKLVEEIFQKLRILIENGMSILMVEQNVVRSLQVSDYCYVLEKGRVLIHDRSEVLSSREDLKDQYFGIQ